MLNFYRHFPDGTVSFSFGLHRGGTPFRFSDDPSFNGTLHFLTPPRESRRAWIAEIRQLAQCRHFTHIHLHAGWNNAWALLGLVGVTVVKVAHSHSVFPATGLIQRFRNSVARHLISALADIRLACSPEAGHQMFSRRYRVVPNVVDYERFRFKESKRRAIRSRLRLHPRDKVIGHVGFLSPIKNQRRIVEIAGLLAPSDPSLKVLLVGDDLGELRELRARSRQLRIEDRVLFVPESREVQDYLHAMDLFIFPSLHEGFGMALLEAQISGLPALVSDHLPRLAVISEQVHFVGLDDGITVWADMVEAILAEPNPPEERLRRSEAIPRVYDAADHSEQLRQVYLAS